MNNNFNKILIPFFLSVFLFTSISFAQSTSTKKDSDKDQIEVSFPINKDDFLLFYGVTQDDTVNQKINDLRKDFMTKFEASKVEYKNSLDQVVGDKELSPSLLDDTKKNTSLKSVNISVKSTSKPTKSVISLSNDQVSITPLINIVDPQSVIHIESNSWFKKVKSFFGW